MKKGLLLARLAVKDLLNQKASLGFALFGLITGSATLVFFFALVQGVRGEVINKLFPVNLIEFTPISGLNISGNRGIAPDFIHKISGLPGVKRVFPKKKGQFQAILWGRIPLVSYKLNLEAFFDGVAPELVQKDITPKPDPNHPFTYLGEVVPCSKDDQCTGDARCISGFCGLACGAKCKGKCVSNRCLPACRATKDCLPGRVCIRGACQPLACEVDDIRAFFKDDKTGIKGRIKGFLFGRDQGWPKGGCPGSTYCATFNLGTRQGVCEAPIPVVLSPLLTELYNSVASSAFHLPTLKDLSILKGLHFFILYGESYFVRNAKHNKQVIKQAQIVGFSPEAIDLGVTMPLTYVEQANAQMMGKAAAETVTSVLIKTMTNDAVPQVVREMGDYGLVPSTKYQASKRMAEVLFILSIVFAAVAVIVLVVSSGGIAHVLLMLVNEKAVELALFRSIGATRNAIRGLVLLQGLLIGVVGGIFGVIMARVGALVADHLLIKYFSFLPEAPKSLFVFAPWILGLGLIAAVVSALAGGLLPAERACRIDPAKTLSKG